jgi:two-component system chemotaxis response regulator CheB
MNRDVIAIGASAGGLEVLLNLVGELPRDLPAALFVVVHRPPTEADRLPELLSGRGPLPACHPLHAERIERGRIYIAPPDNQLLVRPGSVEVVRGPRENGHRPAVDPLFRTASAAYGPRVIGVVLSGYQDCGTAGMMSIKARGGVSVVQSPESAQAPEMPESVLRRVPVDHIVHPRELASLLMRLASEPAGPERQPDSVVGQLEGAAPGEPTAVVCPICQGVLTEAHAGKFEHFRCHVGHAFSMESLVREQSESMERALWAAVRALEESSGLSRRLALRESGELSHRFGEKAHTQIEQADLIREILLNGGMLTPPDARALGNDNDGDNENDGG